jgi:hypothetical protein
MGSIDLQLIDPDCKQIHARTYTVSRSAGRQLQQSKEIVRLVDTGVLEKYYSPEWASICPSFTIPKKNGTIRFVTDFRKLNLLLKHRMSPISHSKDWGHDPFNVRLTFPLSIDLNMAIITIK